MGTFQQPNYLSEATWLRLLAAVPPVEKIQDAGTSFRPGQIATYHTHGVRQYKGTCKYHIRPDCVHLLRWKPMKGMSKTIMREGFDFEQQIGEPDRCKTCWRY